MLTATAVLVWLVGRGVMIRVVTATLTAVPLPSTMQAMLMLLVMVQALQPQQTKRILTMCVFFFDDFSAIPSK